MYYSDNKFNTKLGRDRATLFSMNMKYRPGIVFSDIKDFDSYLPKYYLKEDSIEWSNAKQQALQYALNFDYDYSSATKIQTKDDIEKVLKEIIYNPVWDSGLRIGKYDKLS